jgi:predicted ATPase
MQSVLARATADLGKLAEAFESVDQALEESEERGERWWEAELYHVRGLLLVARGQPDDSETCIRQSIEISRRQGARALELRASTSLAGLWRGQGRRTEAHDLLAAIYGWFTGGLDTPDLKDAKALLAQLTE